MILSLGTLNKPQWRLLWGTLKGYFLIAPRPRSAYPTQSKPLKIILDIRYQHAIMHAITIRFYPAQRTMLARQAVLLTPSNFSGSTPLLSCQPAFARKPFVSSLFHTLLESAHPHDSTAFSIPLFSYTYALFCTQQKLNSFIFIRFRTLCAKHPGWGPYTHGGEPKPATSRIAAGPFQFEKTLRNKRTVSANARSVASGSKRGPSSRVKACSAGYSNVL